jgi:hypothetical protein
MLKTLGLVPIAPLSLVPTEASEMEMAKNPIVDFGSVDHYIHWGEKTLERRKQTGCVKVGIRRLFVTIRKAVERLYFENMVETPEGLEELAWVIENCHTPHLEEKLVMEKRKRFFSELNDLWKASQSEKLFMFMGSGIINYEFYQGFHYTLHFSRKINDQYYLYTITIEEDLLDFESDADLKIEITGCKNITKEVADGYWFTDEWDAFG